MLFADAAMTSQEMKLSTANPRYVLLRLAGIKASSRYYAVASGSCVKPATVAGLSSLL